MQQYKFSIVCYFAPEVTAEIRALQEELSALTGSTGSLQAWLPHVTVGSGLTVNEDQLEAFYKKIEHTLSDFTETKITTKEFSFLDNWSGARLGLSPYVVYIKPVDCGSLPEIANFFECAVKPEYPAWFDQPWPYNPHITIAYKDLTEEGYRMAQTHLTGKVFEREIHIDNVCLAIEGDDGHWREFKRFPLL